MNVETTKTSSLKALVERYQVCWEVWPENVMVGGERRQIGFTLELLGTHEHGVEHPEPGCPHCHRVFAALAEIAEAIVPQGERESSYRIAPYTQALRYSPRRGNRADVTLAITILHRNDFARLVDACEVRCLKEMCDRLRELGAPEHRWEGRREDRQ